MRNGDCAHVAACIQLESCTCKGSYAQRKDGNSRRQGVATLTLDDPSLITRAFVTLLVLS